MSASRSRTDRTLLASPIRRITRLAPLRATSRCERSRATSSAFTKSSGSRAVTRWPMHCATSQVSEPLSTGPSRHSIWGVSRLPHSCSRTGAGPCPPTKRAVAHSASISPSADGLIRYGLSIGSRLAPLTRGPSLAPSITPYPDGLRRYGVERRLAVCLRNRPAARARPVVALVGCSPRASSVVHDRTCAVTSVTSGGKSRSSARRSGRRISRRGAPNLPPLRGVLRHPVGPSRPLPLMSSEARSTQGRRAAREAPDTNYPTG